MKKLRPARSLRPRENLLDECIDRRLAKEIEGYEVLTVSQAGWAGIKNGELLSRVQSEFDVFITVDRNLTFQQNIPKFTIAVIVLQTSTNRLKDLRPLLSKLLQTISIAPKGQVSRVGP